MSLLKFTINKAMEIESIELNINDNEIMHLNNGGEPSSEEGGSRSSFVSRKMLLINPVNIKICM